MRSRAILLPRRRGEAIGKALEVGVDLRRDVDAARCECRSAAPPAWRRDAVGARSAVRQDEADDVRGAQGARGQEGHQRRVDAAREPEHRAPQPALVHFGANEVHQDAFQEVGVELTVAVALAQALHHGAGDARARGAAPRRTCRRRFLPARRHGSGSQPARPCTPARRTRRSPWMRASSASVMSSLSLRRVGSPTR